MGAMFTQHQREVLIRRISRAVLWSDIRGSNTEQYRCSRATAVAEAVMDELEVSGFSAAAQRRAVAKVAARLEEAS